MEPDVESDPGRVWYDLAEPTWTAAQLLLGAAARTEATAKDPAAPRARVAAFDPPERSYPAG